MILGFRKKIPSFKNKKKNENNIFEVLDFLKIISDENRLRILMLLHNQEKCVCEIWRELGLSQNLVSHHLKVMKEFGLLKTQREGVKIVYFFDYENMKRCVGKVNRLLVEK